MLLVAFAVFIWAYIYFSCKGPDYLRSEKYSLSKLAIEKGMIGDNITGSFTQTLTGNTKALTAAPNPQSSSDQEDPT